MILAEKEKKHFSPEFRSYSTWARKFHKNRKKKSKINKHLSALFLAKTGLNRPRKREKTFSPEFRSYSAREENSEKNSKKIKKKKNLKTSLRHYF